MTSPTLNYDLFAPASIHFGWGRRRELGAVARKLGHRALLVTGSRKLSARGAVEELCQSLRTAGVESIPLAEIHHEPLVEDVDAVTAQLTQMTPGEGDFVLAVGGGSAIDLAKAVAAMATNSRGASVKDFLEGVGTGRTIDQPPLPVLAMPTTAGTGSEATKNSVISSLDPPFKKSLRSELMLPKAVLIDPELTVGLAPTVTAHSGLDALTQLIESYISCRAKPIPRALAIEALPRAMHALPIAYREPHDRAAREAMAHAALVSGIALANAGLGMAHGVAAALGVHCGVAHGLACAVMLPVGLEANREVAARSLAELEWAVRVYPHEPVETQSDEALADSFIRRIRQLCDELSIPRRLSEIGVTPDQIPALVAASHGNSMNGNPRPISDDELTTRLEAML